MDQIPQYADERLTAELDGRCLYCGRPFSADVRESRDHVPSKALLRAPFPENLPNIPSCVECNRGFSLDEQYVQAFLGCVLVGSANPDDQTDPAVRAALIHSPALGAQIAESMREPNTPGGPIVWAPEHERLVAVLTKNARGHLWHEHADYRPGPPTVAYAALASLTDEERERFENPPGLSAALPEVGTRALARMFSGDWFDGWVFVQDDRYRYAVDYLDDDMVRVRSVIAECLATEAVWRDGA